MASQNLPHFLFVLHNVFTPTRNALDLSMHRSKKEHTKYMKEHEDTYASFFLRKVWICRDPISLILGTRFSLILGTR